MKHFDNIVGCKIFSIELDQEDWPQINKIMSQLRDSGDLQHISHRATLHENTAHDRRDYSAVCAFHIDKVNHMKYDFCMSFA